MGGICDAYGKEERCTQGFCDRKRPPGKLKRKWKNNIKMEF
jgi:hypothetical protein